jgi:DNA-binding transcriptional regulator YdaS (Cro superfamily)
MSSPNEAINHAIRLAITLMDGSAKAAAKLGIKPQNFSHWTGDRGTKVAPEHCVVIERETAGKVTRKDLRPDDWWAIWPELPGADRARRQAQKATA